MTRGAQSAVDLHCHFHYNLENFWDLSTICARVPLSLVSSPTPCKRRGHLHLWDDVFSSSGHSLLQLYKVILEFQTLRYRSKNLLSHGESSFRQQLSALNGVKAISDCCNRCLLGRKQTPHIYGTRRRQTNLNVPLVTGSALTAGV